MDKKTVKTNVTAQDLLDARGGSGDAGQYRLTVECPADYDPDRITADDILHDSQIILVD